MKWRYVDCWGSKLLRYVVHSRSLGLEINSRAIQGLGCRMEMYVGLGFKLSRYIASWAQVEVYFGLKVVGFLSLRYAEVRVSRGAIISGSGSK